MTTLSIPPEVAATVDDYHLSKLYCVCRFCFTRVRLERRQTKKPGPTEQLCQRTLKYYGIDFKREIVNLRLPKVLCGPCSCRLSDFERGKVKYEKWSEEKLHYYDSLARDCEFVTTRTSTVCSRDNRCKVCSIASRFIPNATLRLQSNTPKPGRPTKHSPVRKICSRCGVAEDEHDDKHCKMALKRPCAAGKIFAARTKARGYVDRLVAERLGERFEEAFHQDGGSQPSVLPTGVALFDTRLLYSRLKNHVEYYERIFVIEY